MALPGISDVIQNGRQDGHHFRCYSKFKCIEKMRKMKTLFLLEL